MESLHCVEFIISVLWGVIIRASDWNSIRGTAFLLGPFQNGEGGNTDGQNGARRSG